MERILENQGKCAACGRVLVHSRGPMCNGDVCLKTKKKWKPPKKKNQCPKCEGILMEVMDVTGDLVVKCFSCGEEVVRRKKNAMVRPLKEGNKKGKERKSVKLPEPKIPPPGQKPKRPKEYCFEQFFRDGSWGKPHVALWRGSKKIHVSSAFFKKWGFENHGYVHLFWDEENRMIGFRPVETKDRDTFRLIPDARVYGKVIHATAFFKGCGIKIEKAERHPIEYDKELDLFIFQIKNGATETIRSKPS